MNLIKTHFSSKLTNQPAGFYTLLYTETCELFGQFAIMALLVLYMTSTFKTGDNRAFSCYGAFSAFIYAIPLLGGYFADRIFGFKPSLLLGIALMVLGNIVLVIPDLHYMYFGLALFSVGCGFFTPTITAVLGRLYAAHETKRDNAFILYYMAKNLGALLSTLICSLVAVKYGYNYAYLISTIVMISGYIVFIRGSKTLAPYLTSTIKTNATSKKSIILVAVAILSLLAITEIVLLTNTSALLMGIVSFVAMIVIAMLYKKFTKQERKNLSLILCAVIMMIVFSTFLGQGGTTLNLFIQRIVDRSVGSYIIPPSMFYALDPFFMLLFGTLVMAMLDRIKGKNEVTIGFSKIAVGLAILGVGFMVFVAAASVMIHSQLKPDVGYVIGAYMLFPVAELSIMPIVISLITRIAPRGYDGFMIGLYMLGSAIASYLTGWFSKTGNIHFATDSLASLVKAAQVYQHVFMLSAGILFIAALISLMLIFAYQRRLTALN